MSSQRPEKPILFVTFGFPGSGKTYFARQFAREQKLLHLNSDCIRSLLAPRPTYTADETVAVFEVMNFMAAEALRCGTSVIYDANVTKRIFRRRLQVLARKNGGHYALIWLKLPVEAALKWLAVRRQPGWSRKYYPKVDDRILFALKKETELPTSQEFCVQVDGLTTYRLKKAKILAALNPVQVRT